MSTQPEQILENKLVSSIRKTKLMKKSIIKDEKSLNL